MSHSIITHIDRQTVFIILYYATVRSDFHDKISQIESVVAVRDVAHIRVPRFGLGVVRHVRTQGN